MSDRGSRRGLGAPFYTPPRRKTSAEIISEARAAIRGEMSSSGTSLGALRPLRTRRPFTPREPQRSLYNDRTKKNGNARPPSSFDLKYLTLDENEESLVTAGAQIAGLDDEDLTALTEPHGHVKKKPLSRSKTTSLEKSNEWSGFPKLPHLSGKSKPLHRRNTTNNGDVHSNESDLSNAISTRPIGSSAGDASFFSTQTLLPNKALSPDVNKRRQYSSHKSMSYDPSVGALGDVGIKQIAVQMPKTKHDGYESLTVLEIAEKLSQKNRDDSRTLELLKALQKKIEVSIPANSLLELVLKSLYSHIDGDDEVLAAIARAMLTMRVVGPHLAAACKVIFKIARNDKNDHLFKNSNLLDLLVDGCARAEPVSEGECCAHAAGALRLLALEPALRERAHRAGALHLAGLHLKILNNAKAERPRHVSEQSTHALYQLTGALRNLANATEHSRSFVSSGALAELVAALQLHTDRDVLTNVARCLSVLSAQDACCAWLCASARAAGGVLGALCACAPRAPLAVRLAYTLGNMAAADEQARLNIYNEENSIDVLLTILESYTKRHDSDARDLNTDPDLHLVGSDLGGSDGSNEDVLIKTVRIIANLCLSESVGKSIGELHAARTVRALLACLDVADESLKNESEITDSEQQSRTDRHDELAMAALATLNNVTFYLDPPPSSRNLDETIDLLCKATCAWARGAGPAGGEALRALGNLSRSARAAQLLVLEGALQLLPPFHAHEDPGVRCAAAGLLVNVCGAGCGAEGAEVASRALAAAARAGDAPAAALLARALWNAHAHAPLDSACAKMAADALSTFLEDDSVFCDCEAQYAVGRECDQKAHVKFVDNQGDIEILQEPNVTCTGGQQRMEFRSGEDAERNGYSGEDLGFEDGEIEECECEACRRLAAWEELVGVAIPLLERLRPSRADASVGTD